jgi:hypothetical protein
MTVEFSHFYALLQCCPTLFALLVRRQRSDDSGELRRGVLAFFGNMNQSDWFDYRFPGSLRRKRVLRLAALAKLDPKDAFLPMAIYEDHESGAFYRDNPALRYSDEVVRFHLTAGSIPIEYFFVVGNIIRRWRPEDEELVGIFTLDGDPQMAQAEKDLLRSLGSEFSSDPEVFKEVSRRGLRTAPTST